MTSQTQQLSSLVATPTQLRYQELIQRSKRKTLWHLRVIMWQRRWFLAQVGSMLSCIAVKKMESRWKSLGPYSQASCTSQWWTECTARAWEPWPKDTVPCTFSHTSCISDHRPAPSCTNRLVLCTKDTLSDLINHVTHWANSMMVRTKMKKISMSSMKKRKKKRRSSSSKLFPTSKWSLTSPQASTLLCSLSP